MTTPPVQLTPLRTRDIDELLPIERELFGVEQWTRAMFDSELAQGHYYLVARDSDGTVLGYGGLAVVPPREAWVNNLAVRQVAQRRGVGRLLLEALLARARWRGVHRVLLEVAVDNEPAQRLYGGYGFEPVGIRRGYYQPSNTDAMVMACEL